MFPAVPRDRRLSRIASTSGTGPPKYVDVIAVDDGSASQSGRFGSGLDQWVSDDDWTPGFRWLNDKFTKRNPYARVLLYRPDTSLDTAPGSFRCDYFLSQIQARREAMEDRPTMFIAYGKRAELVRQIVLANSKREAKDQAFAADHVTVLTLGGLPPAQRRSFLERTFLSQLISYEEMLDWRPGIRANLENPSRERLQQRPTQSTNRDYNKPLEKLQSQLLQLIPALLIVASVNGDLKTVTSLIERKPGVQNIAKDASQATPLIVASTAGHRDVVEYLLKKMTKTNEHDVNGSTALHAAATAGHEEVVELLVKNANVNVVNKNGWTPLMKAAGFGHWYLIKPLIDAGADVNAQVPSNGNTSLLLASSCGFDFTVEELITSGASNIDIDHANKVGWTALIAASHRGDSSIARILLRHGADFTKVDRNGKAAFSLAASESVLAVLRGALLLQICCDSKLTEADFAQIEQLLAQGADIDQRNREGKSALDYADARRNDRLRKQLENPPLSNGPRSYKSGRTFEVLNWPKSVDARSDKEVHCEVIDFHIEAGSGKEKRFRRNPAPSVFDLMYREPSETINDLMSNMIVKGSDADFRWIHLPACNLTWVRDLMIRIALERNSDGNEVDAHDLDEMLARLLTRDDWKQQQPPNSETPQRMPFLKPQATFVRRAPGAQALMGDNSLIFMPYLHYESRSRFLEMSRYLQPESETVHPEDMHIVERLLRTYYHEEYPLHPRRTLDQFYYDPLDTKARDEDQVVYRYMEKVLKSDDPQLFMVDQLWIWILDGGRTVISCFPRQWKIQDKDRENPLHAIQRTDVLSSILRKLESPDRPEICSAYELAVLICTHCYGTFFDPSRAIGDELNFMQFFEQSIGNVSNDGTMRFQELRGVFEYMNGLLTLFGDLEDNPDRKVQQELLAKFGNLYVNSRGLSLTSFYDLVHSQGPVESDGLTRTKYEEFFFEFSYKLLDISMEVNLLNEIKDIRDELSIIHLIFDDQILAIESMLDLIDSGDVRHAPDGARNASRSRAPSGRSPPPNRAVFRSIIESAASETNTTTYNFNNFLQTLKRQREVIHKMDKRADRIYLDIEQLLDLKQKQASVFEAHFSGRQAEKQRQLLEESRRQTDKAGQQGNTVMVFTVVTVIFLPASFMAAFFALNITELPHSDDGSDLKLPLKYVAAWIVGVTGICVFIVGGIGFNINRLGGQIANSFLAKWYKKAQVKRWHILLFRALIFVVTLPARIWRAFRPGEETGDEGRPSIPNAESADEPTASSAITNGNRRKSVGNEEKV